MRIFLLPFTHHAINFIQSLNNFFRINILDSTITFTLLLLLVFDANHILLDNSAKTWVTDLGLS